HDERAASGETGELFGLSRQDSRVLFTADVGDRVELQEGGEAAGVQMPVGSGEDGAQEEKSGPLELLHAPRPLDEMRRDVLEDGAGDVAAASESRMRPGASGADAPEMERERARAPAQEGEAVLHVAVVETGRRAAAAEARQVEGEGVIARGAERLDPAAVMEVGPPPGDPGVEEEDGATHRQSLRGRIPGRGEDSRAAAA